MNIIVVLLSTLVIISCSQLHPKPSNNYDGVIYDYEVEKTNRLGYGDYGSYGVDEHEFYGGYEHEEDENVNDEPFIPAGFQIGHPNQIDSYGRCIEWNEETKQVQLCTGRKEQDGEIFEKYHQEELGLLNGNGDVFKWIQTVDGLDNWERNLQLGNAYINTSASLETSRARFTLGLLAMHNFMYDQAIELFTSALNDERQIAKKHFPMAYWGIALSSKYMFWSSSNCKIGKQAVIAIPEDYKEQVTEKEAAFISMAYALFPPDKKCKDDTENQRENRFTGAAATFLKKYPDDLEGQLFYGMGKLATLNHPECQPATPKYMVCQDQKQTVRSLLDVLYERYQTHSGLIHYVIHVYDTPAIFLESIKLFIHEHIEPEKQKNNKTALGIKASYDYPKIAKSSSHGLHMPSHIFLRTGNWRMSLKSNLDSIKVCDEYALARGKHFAYDKGNLYHSVEYAQNDLIQLGRYKEANQQFKRMGKALQLQLESSQYKTDENVRWFKELVFRMRARQVLDPYTENPQEAGHGGRVNKCLPDGESVVNDDISAAQMTYAALSEAGAMLTSGIAAAKEKKSSVWRMCIKELEQLSDKLESKKYLETMMYSKQAIRMMKEMLYGVAQLADAVRYAVPINGNIDIDDDKTKIIKSYLKNATIIQDQMKQTYLTVTLLFIPSYELYGQVLLMLEEYKEASEMFEKSILNTMGRANSLVGLARSHAMLGNENEANYFYEYVKGQLSGADKGNLYLEEAEQWSKTKSPKDIRSFFKWPCV